MKGTLLVLVLMLAGCAASPPAPWVVSDFDEHKVELTRGSHSDLNGSQLREAANRICQKYGGVADVEIGAMREECVRASESTYCYRTSRFSYRTNCSITESCDAWRQVAVIACLRE